MSWKAIIEAAEKRGSFTVPNKRKAWSWKTCAVGETVKLQFNEEPKDLVVNELGFEFSRAVQNDKPTHAKYLLREIQLAGSK